MGSQIASKNLYELLGNDPELDPDREPEPPTKVIDKPVARSGKRNAGAEGPSVDTDRPRGGGRGGGHQVERRADLTDRGPAANNRADQRDDGLRQDRHPDRLRDPRQHREIGGRGGHSRGGRGTRGGRGRGDYATTRTARDDRHNHSGIGEHEKQAAHGWGGQGGEQEWGDEKAGEAIAQAEAKNEPGFVPDTDAGDPAFTNGPDGVTTDVDAPAEPEDKTKSYDEYLAEQAEKRLALSGGAQELRKANEGSKQKFPEGTALQRNPQGEDFFAGAAGKNRKQKEAKEKATLSLEGQYYAPVEQDRGGRGRGRGGGFRGDKGGRGGGERGERGDREFRGGRGGGRGRGDRGEFRGSRGGDRGDRGSGGQRGGFNPSDESAFPSLGGN